MLFCLTCAIADLDVYVIDHAILKGQHRKESAWFSVSDSLPLISASAEWVARATIAALRRGDAEVIVPSDGAEQ
ncbi:MULTISPECIES: hypothetical protein [unclassified Leptolyngbya]|uniref:hypothetical protein n=1 Tax=unclassified Leptolyngbya TaxID=2650499 RepID=UPI0016885E23|nr:MULTISPECIES: hypothetical protein [unclassified Leptolyngbya]MBD1909164.1 hypothetical protein [Leptolyngbya sp. FACHB-8]MBD2158455.1 hypothetical protein [Leptolyngbya sp. FACHB-16]